MDLEIVCIPIPYYPIALPLNSKDFINDSLLIVLEKWQELKILSFKNKEA